MITTQDNIDKTPPTATIATTDPSTTSCARPPCLPPNHPQLAQSPNQPTKPNPDRFSIQTYHSTPASPQLHANIQPHLSPSLLALVKPGSRPQAPSCAFLPQKAPKSAISTSGTPPTRANDSGQHVRDSYTQAMSRRMIDFGLACLSCGLW